MSTGKKEQIYIVLKKLFLPTKYDKTSSAESKRLNLYEKIRSYIEKQLLIEYEKGKDKANLLKMAILHEIMNNFEPIGTFKFRK